MPFRPEAYRRCAPRCPRGALRWRPSGGKWLRPVRYPRISSNFTIGRSRSPWASPWLQWRSLTLLRRPVTCVDTASRLGRRDEERMP